MHYKSFTVSEILKNFQFNDKPMSPSETSPQSNTADDSNREQIKNTSYCNSFPNNVQEIPQRPIQEVLRSNILFDQGEIPPENTFYVQTAYGAEQFPYMPSEPNNYVLNEHPYTQNDHNLNQNGAYQLNMTEIGVYPNQDLTNGENIAANTSYQNTDIYGGEVYLENNVEFNQSFANVAETDNNPGIRNEYAHMDNHAYGEPIEINHFNLHPDIDYRYYLDRYYSQQENNTQNYPDENYPILSEDVVVNNPEPNQGVINACFTTSDDINQETINQNYPIPNPNTGIIYEHRQNIAEVEIYNTDIIDGIGDGNYVTHPQHPPIQRQQSCFQCQPNEEFSNFDNHNNNELACRRPNIIGPPIYTNNTNQPYSVSRDCLNHSRERNYVPHGHSPRRLPSDLQYPVNVPHFPPWNYDDDPALYNYPPYYDFPFHPYYPYAYDHDYALDYHMQRSFQHLEPPVNHQHQMERNHQYARAGYETFWQRESSHSYRNHISDWQEQIPHEINEFLYDTPLPYFIPQYPYGEMYNPRIHRNPYRYNNYRGNRYPYRYPYPLRHPNDRHNRNDRLTRNPHFPLPPALENRPVEMLEDPPTNQFRDKVPENGEQPKVDVNKCLENTQNKQREVEDFLSQFNRRKKRSTFTAYQLSEMIKFYKERKYISSTDRKKLAEKINVDPVQVKIWWQNRRNKEKKLQEKAQRSNQVLQSSTRRRDSSRERSSIESLSTNSTDIKECETSVEAK